MDSKLRDTHRVRRITASARAVRLLTSVVTATQKGSPKFPHGSIKA